MPVSHQTKIWFVVRTSTFCMLTVILDLVQFRRPVHALAPPEKASLGYSHIIQLIKIKIYDNFVVLLFKIAINTFWMTINYSPDTCHLRPSLYLRSSFILTRHWVCCVREIVLLLINSRALPQSFQRFYKTFKIKNLFDLKCHIMTRWLHEISRSISCASK